MLSSEERGLLVKYGWGHLVGRCPKCGSAYMMQDLGTRLSRQQSHFCPRCRISLMNSLRAHLASCTAMRIQRSAIRGWGRDAHDEAV
jgi:transposase-like protein